MLADPFLPVVERAPMWRWALLGLLVAVRLEATELLLEVEGPQGRETFRVEAPPGATVGDLRKTLAAAGYTLTDAHRYPDPPARPDPAHLERWSPRP